MECCDKHRLLAVMHESLIIDPKFVNIFEKTINTNCGEGCSYFMDVDLYGTFPTFNVICIIKSLKEAKYQIKVPSLNVK